MSVSFRGVMFGALVVVTPLALGCAGPPEQRGLSVVMPTHAGEGHGDGHARPARTAASPGAGAAPAVPSPGSPAAAEGTARPAVEHGTQPDPIPLSTQHQWDLTLHYAKGTVRLVEAKALELDAPVSTPRRMGRFAVELWVGKELVDRV